MIDLTDTEKEFLTILFRIGQNILNGTSGNYEMSSYDDFSNNDLFNLACKFGIENDY